MKAMLSLTVFTILMSSNALAEWRLKNTQLRSSGESSELVMEMEGKGERPVVSIKDGVLQVEAKNLVIWPKIEKTTEWQGKKVTLMAYQFSKDFGRIRLVNNTPWPLSEGQLELKETTDGWSVTIPAGNSNDNVVENKFDERYLEQLLKDKEAGANVPSEKRDQINVVHAANSKNTTEKAGAGLLAAGENANTNDHETKAKSSSNPIWGLVMRFTGFLAAIIAALWGIVLVFRKGFLSRGKLGFLKGDFLVSVVATTYIAPKRSVVVVRVNKQVFLLGNSEAGITNLGEISDVAGLLKDAESTSTGSNFDQEMVSANKKEKMFRLKEMDTLRSNEEAIHSDGNLSKEFDTFAPKEDREKISDQIKRKIKTLKALQ